MCAIGSIETILKVSFAGLCFWLNSMVAEKFLYVSMTPFGFPVEPEV